MSKQDFSFSMAQTAIGVASLAPVQSNSEEACRTKNRRVELLLQQVPRFGARGDAV